MWKGDNKARNIGKTPQDPQVVPIAVPIPIALSLPHPVPITFLYCFSCFSPITKGHFSSTGRVHIPQKCTWKGSKGRKSLKCPKGGARARCPQPCPSPRGAQGLKQRSHSSSAAGASACRLCPAGWQPFAAKCYWVSTKTSTWEEAAENCGYQRSQLVVLESAEEKVRNCGGKGPSDTSAFSFFKAFLLAKSHVVVELSPSWLAKRPSPHNQCDGSG